MNTRPRLLRKVAALAHDIVAVSRFVHSHPEEGFHERECSEFLCAALANQGFRIEKPLPRLPTAFRASRRGRRPGPAIGFIAEYDSLPGIGHGCGHNLIAASAFGAAAALGSLVDETGGSVWVFGTPAEEYGSGKVPMLKARVFAPAQAVLMAHPETFWLVNTACLALDALKFEFRGRTSHAAATPWEGRNALDAVIGLFNGISALRQQLKPDVRVHGIITKGGDAPNVIPDHTAAEFYVRALRRRDLDEVTARVKDCARAAALAAGCRVKIVDSEPPLDDMVNNPVLAAVVERQLRGLGIKDIATEDSVPGSADIGNVSHRIPTIYFYCPVAPPGMDLHTREFARQAVTDQAHQGLLKAVQALALSGLELLRKPALVKEARQALQRSSSR
ncbi:MAG: M20 family metallopeptidase [Elusimicrobia bacterium]|nr:M20 family metallopeptidase [Elusimicrobiota bacterium]